ncbi:hypothetical protein KMAR_30136 [Kluyveromyces marxianus]|nr:hypothetical protein KMAR_30136 [Kluyveromyces marxianus]
MVIRDKSLTSVLQTTSESILNPLAAKVPETNDNTPGSFCTRQFNTCCFLGSFDGAGVSYKIDEIALFVDQDGVSIVGKGGLVLFLCSCLYARAEVDEDLALARLLKAN